MKKRSLILLMLLPVFGFSQKSLPSYSTLRADYGHSKDFPTLVGLSATYGSILAPGLGSAIGAGVLSEATNSVLKKLYVPIFLEVAGIPMDQKFQPVIVVRVGWGFYSNSIRSNGIEIKTSGNLYASTMAGLAVRLKDKTSQLQFLAGADIIRLTTQISSRQTASTSKTHIPFKIGFGIRI